MTTATGYNTAIGAQTAVPRPASQSGNQLTQLREAAQEVEGLVAELEGRLEHVLRSQPDSKVTNGACPPDEYIVPHADAIRSVRKTSENTAARLRDILARLEA